ncbi:hypothetical protein HAT2_00152 [Candidatus Similichlamydia laticola]|uniref:Uncharacterized protein n=2 Tax=Candidatus Similichlamydia laticola TaxID=2170265 RepID=A0A369KDU3_9BACT|nr:hypothetical protein HAT2_00152 [Candidatus Similichlamydia laticola]
MDRLGVVQESVAKLSLRGRQKQKQAKRTEIHPVLITPVKKRALLRLFKLSPRSFPTSAIRDCMSLKGSRLFFQNNVFSKIRPCLRSARQSASRTLYTISWHRTSFFWIKPLFMVTGLFFLLLLLCRLIKFLIKRWKPTEEEKKKMREEIREQLLQDVSVREEAKQALMNDPAMKVSVRGILKETLKPEVIRQLKETLIQEKTQKKRTRN